MEGILLLLLVFSIWQFIEHRKNRKQADVNWAEVAQCEAELADSHPEKIIVLPTMEERIDSCYQTLEECQEEWLRSEAEFRTMHGEEDEASPSMEMVDLLYTANHMHRAVIFKAERQYFLSLRTCGCTANIPCTIFMSLEGPAGNGNMMAANATWTTSTPPVPQPAMY